MTSNNKKGYFDADTGEADAVFIKLAYKFIRGRARAARAALLFLMLLSTYLIAVSSYAVYEAFKPARIATLTHDERGEVSTITAYRKPKLTDLQVMRWAGEQSTELLSIHFNNFRSQLDKRRNLFVGDGFQKYLAALNKFKTADFVSKNAVIITAVVRDVPHVAAIYTSEGNKTWQFEIPLMQTIYGANDDPKTKNLIAHITVEEAERSKILAGLKIKNFKIQG